MHVQGLQPCPIPIRVPAPAFAPASGRIAAPARLCPAVHPLVECRFSHGRVREFCFCSTAVVSTTCETSKDSPRMAWGSMTLRAFSVDATRACARIPLSPHSPLSSAAPMRSQRTHTPAEIDARARMLPVAHEPSSTVPDPGSRWIGDGAIDPRSLHETPWRSAQSAAATSPGSWSSRKNRFLPLSAASNGLHRNNSSAIAP